MANNHQPPFEVFLIATEKNSKPCIEIRRNTADSEIIKTIILAAFHQRTIIVQPVFRDRFKSINTLVEKGILYRDQESGQYFFTV